MANFGARAQKPTTVNYINPYLQRQAVSGVPTTGKTAGQQYAGIRMNGVQDYYKDKPKGKDAGTYGPNRVYAIPANLPAAQAAAQAAQKPAEENTTGKPGKGRTYTVNANNQPYVDQLNSLYEQIMNRKPFQYDLNADLLYKQMADRYTQMGQQAMQDATGVAASLTGGYGNSYATQVGQQAYQQYLTALNDNIPDLRNQAYQEYLAEGDRLLQLYQLTATHPEALNAIKPRTYTVRTEDDSEESGSQTQGAAAAGMPPNWSDSAYAQYLAATVLNNPYADYYYQILMGKK